MTRVLLIGDVGTGDGQFHVGDEAMFAVARAEIAKRGIDSLAATSADPVDTSQRYGVDAIERLGFSAERTPRQADRDQRLDDIVRSAQGETGLLAWQDPAWAVIERIASADAVLICGGGNLNSSWPEHIYERAAIARLCKVFSVRLVISGQTIGPALTQRDGQLVAETIAAASLVGLREETSYETAQALGEFPTLARTIDDAAFIDHADALPESVIADSYCVATFAPYTGSAPADDFVRRIAQFLDDVVETTDLDVVLLPHQATIASELVNGDRGIHSRIAAAMTSDRVIELGIPTPEEAAAIAGNAAISVSTRYHPAVFALAAGVPAITFSTDDYTDIKLSGALANFGLPDGALSSVALATDDANDTFARIWKDREAIRQHLLAVAADRTEGWRAWWDGVAAALRGERVEIPRWVIAGERKTLPARLRERNARLRTWIRDEGRARIGNDIAQRASIEDIAALRLVVGQTENALGEARAETDVALQRALEAEAALSAAQDLLSQIAEPLYEKTIRTHPTVVREEELQALLNSRTFRWTSRPRAAYGSVRRLLGR